GHQGVVKAGLDIRAANRHVLALAPSGPGRATPSLRHSRPPEYVPGRVSWTLFVVPFRTCYSRGLLLRRCLAATGHRPAGPLPHARVRSGALAVDRQIAPVPDPTVAADLHQPLDVQVHLAP